MVSKTTSTSGFTLPEMLVATWLATTVMMLVGTIMVQVGYSLQAIQNYSGFEQISRFALDTLTRDIRQANAVSQCNSSSLVLNSPSGTISYTYSSSAQTLTRTGTNNTQAVLLNNCIQFQFNMFQRCPTGGAVYDQFPAGTAGIAKLVQISWTCGTTNANGTINTTDCQSSKVVLRKE